MSVNRVFTLLIQEIRQSFKGFFIFQIILAPLSLWLIITLLFGQFAIGIPRIGLMQDERSRLIEPLTEGTELSRFDNKEQLIEQVREGEIDMGVILSRDFDSTVRKGQKATMSLYIWGGTPLQRRLQAGIRLQQGALNLVDNSRVNINPEILGNTDVKPWYIRLIPLVVLISIMIGGMMVPATSLVKEKQSKTINALLVTPISLREVLSAKMIYGAIVSFAMGLMILILNKSLGPEPLPLLFVLILAAISAASFGSILGFIAKDVKAVGTIGQSIMLIIYAPAILNLFPNIPEWVQKVFPTYYFFSPVLKLSNGSFSLAADGWEVVVLASIFILLQLILYIMVRRSKKR
ncbi:MAG: ABC transporter permease, partial [Halanaerobiales bacterium]